MRAFLEYKRPAPDATPVTRFPYSSWDEDGQKKCATEARKLEVSVPGNRIFWFHIPLTATWPLLRHSHSGPTLAFFPIFPEAQTKKSLINQSLRIWWYPVLALACIVKEVVKLSYHVDTWRYQIKCYERKAFTKRSKVSLYQSRRPKVLNFAGDHNLEWHLLLHSLRFFLSGRPRCPTPYLTAMDLLLFSTNGKVVVDVWTLLCGVTLYEMCRMKEQVINGMWNEYYWVQRIVSVSFILWSKILLYTCNLK